MIPVSIASAISIAHQVSLRPVTPEEIAVIKNLDPDEAEVLSAVMSRLSFVDALRYELPMDAQDLTQGMDRDGLEVYLLCTCIDSLAGDARYLDLQSWLRTKRRTASGVEARNSMVEAAVAAQPFSVDSFNRTLAKALDLYNQHYGTNRRIVQLLHGLPESYVDRLVSAYSMDAEQATADAPTWDSRNTTDKLRAIFIHYLFRHRRNRYTHRSATVPPFGGIAAMLNALRQGRVELPEAKTLAFELHGGRIYRITCHYGDEGLFLRETVLACIAARLGVLDEDWSDRHRDGERRRRALYALRYELEHNRLVMQFHLGVWSQSFTYPNTAGHHWPMLETPIAEAVLENRLSGVPDVGGLDSYIKAAKTFTESMLQSIRAGGTQPDLRASKAAGLISSESLDLNTARLLGLYDDYLSSYPRFVVEPHYVPSRGEP